MLLITKKIINSIEKKCELDTHNFQLYYNELLILNNSALFTSKEKSAYTFDYDGNILI